MIRTQNASRDSGLKPDNKQVATTNYLLATIPGIFFRGQTTENLDCQNVAELIDDSTGAVENSID